MNDVELAAVIRPFNAAFARMCAAGNAGDLRDELSNTLHHLYRLGELCSRRWQTTDSDFNTRTRAVPGVLGALWIRSFDTHEIANLSSVGDLYSDYLTEMYGVLVWNDLTAMPFIDVPKKQVFLDRYNDYSAALAGKTVLDTLRPAFDGLAALL